jgi:DNA-3-methyladenine glycosylase II
MPEHPLYWQKACDVLAGRDKRLASLIAAFPSSRLCRSNPSFITLAKAIVGQQISIKAASAIWLRLEQNGGSTEAGLLRLSDDDLRSIGLSARKIIYLKAVAQYALKGGLEDLATLPEEEAKARLLALPGVGPWTAEMFLIFGLLKPDVLPLSDLGLKKAMALHYALGDDQKSLLAQGDLWRPYRTVATWYLWRSLDAIEVLY